MIVPKPFIRILHKAGVLRFLNLTTRIRVCEKEIFIPLLNRVGLAHCVSQERWLLELMKKLSPYLQDNRSFIDVGVNVGQTLLIAKTLYPDVKYFGFEPNPVCVFYVDELIRKNAISGVTVFPFGLSDHKQMLDLIFFYHDKDDSTASVISGFRSDEVKRQEKVMVFSYDELENNDGYRPGIVKIDVEGSEWEVIKGMITMISHERPCIICEVLPTHHDQNAFRQRRQSALQELLSKHDYLIYHIRLSGQVEKTAKFISQSAVEESNYIFLPGENNIFS
jgi:FkbM family methyltransferase